MNQRLDLGFKSRRQGLTVSTYKSPRLLQTVNSPSATKNLSHEMPPKTYRRLNPAIRAATKGKTAASIEEGINAPPQSSSDEGDRADIQQSVFRKGSEQPKENANDSRTGGGGDKSKKAAVNGKATRGTQNAGASANSSNGSNSSKRKGEIKDDWHGKGLGSSMVDAFGRVNAKPAKKAKTYSASQSSRQPSSQSGQASKRITARSPASPKTSSSFMIPEEIPDSPMNSQITQTSPQNRGFLKPDDLEESFQEPRTPAGKFAVPDELERTPILTPGAEKEFKNPGNCDSPPTPDIKADESFAELDSFTDIPDWSPPKTQMLFEQPANSLPKKDPKKLLELKKNDLGGDLTSKVHNILSQDRDNLGVDSMDLFDDDLDASTIAVAHCPMCGQPCNATELKQWGAMDTRKQERFCRSHRKTTAQKKWVSKGYPEIDWEKLDSRILEHHDFIKRLLNGADCHYRKTFEEMVAAGKGRSLRKLESNLTPGYYGSRGLNTISEFVIREFSRLLSKRSVKDPLMSKRGTTAFVQSVIVPEVAVQLIMKDMSIGDVEARVVLTESANMGELVNEEIKDVVEERFENSEDEGDED